MFNLTSVIIKDLGAWEIHFDGLTDGVIGVEYPLIGSIFGPKEELDDKLLSSSDVSNDMVVSYGCFYADIIPIFHGSRFIFMIRHGQSTKKRGKGR